VDHHLASWIGPAPREIEAIVPADSRPTTTMHLLIERKLVSAPNAMTYVRALCVSQFESDWARVFDGLESGAANDVLRLPELPALLAAGPDGASVPDALYPALQAASRVSGGVAATLGKSHMEETPGLVVAYVTDTHGTKVKRFALALRDAHPGVLVVVVHHGACLYCARDSQVAGPDLLSFFRERQLGGVGHPYVCAVRDVPRDRLAPVLTDLRYLMHQRDRLGHTIQWATWARDTLGALAREFVGRVHFRPSSTGVSVVGLSPDGPQLGAHARQDVARTRTIIEKTLQLAPHRATPEKRLQSFLIASAYRHERRLQPLCEMAASKGEAADLIFVTDELFLPAPCSPKHGIGCDLLAVRCVTPDLVVPAQIELKSARLVTELLEELDRFAPLIDLHARLFEELFGAILRRTVRFAGPAERWVIWPSAGCEPDRQRAAFEERHARLVTYTEPTPGQFEFRLES
jgi:hypothetical protein